MDYRKPSKKRANEEFLRASGFSNSTEPYGENQIEQKKLFLIICEGENTEPCYFEGFPVPTKTVIIEGGCNSKTALVDYALQVAEKEEYVGREIWCVFDFDVKPDERETQLQDFNSAIEKAEARGLHVAWSNDAFELWFLLHFQELDTAISRKEIFNILKDRWGIESFKNTAKTKEFCSKHYERHGGRNSDSQKNAIRRAQRLHVSYAGKKNYADQCPCTTVYLLVEELNKNLKE